LDGAKLRRGRDKMEKPYVEIIGGISMYRSNLTQADLRHIGEFTRWRVAQWLYDPQGPEDSFKDFHAVCGDIDIPWDKEESRSIWEQACPASEVDQNSAAGQPTNPVV
jgi:hypothetical protein